MKRGSSGKTVPVRKEPSFSLLQKAGCLYMTGNYSMKQIADILNDQGVTTMYGHALSTNSIGKFFKCEFYKGVVFAKRRDKRYQGRFEPMFSTEDWQVIQDITSRQIARLVQSYEVESSGIFVISSLLKVCLMQYLVSLASLR